MSFSFKHIDQKSSIFNLSEQQMRYVYIIIDRMKNFSSMRIDELISNGSDALRFHPIDWKDTSQKGGFPVARELWENVSYQFSLGKSRGRIAGFVISNVFYVVWVDPKHRIYPRSY